MSTSTDDEMAAANVDEKKSTHSISKSTAPSLNIPYRKTSRPFVTRVLSFDSNYGKITATKVKLKSIYSKANSIKSCLILYSTGCNLSMILDNESAEIEIYYISEASVCSMPVLKRGWNFISNYGATSITGNSRPSTTKQQIIAIPYDPEPFLSSSACYSSSTPTSIIYTEDNGDEFLTRVRSTNRQEKASIRHQELQRLCV